MNSSERGRGGRGRKFGLHKENEWKGVNTAWYGWTGWGIGKSEIERVRDGRVVRRAAVGRAGLEEEVQSLQDGLSSSAGTSLAFEALGLGFQSEAGVTWFTPPQPPEGTRDDLANPSCCPPVLPTAPLPCSEGQVPATTHQTASVPEKCFSRSRSCAMCHCSPSPQSCHFTQWQ